MRPLTKQVFRELRHVARSCPKGPVANPGNGSTTTTTFHPTPDTDWPQTASVQRGSFQPDHRRCQGRERGLSRGVPAARPGPARRLLLETQWRATSDRRAHEAADIVSASATGSLSFPRTRRGSGVLTGKKAVSRAPRMWAEGKNFSRVSSPDRDLRRILRDIDVLSALPQSSANIWVARSIVTSLRVSGRGPGLPRSRSTSRSTDRCAQPAISSVTIDVPS